MFLENVQLNKQASYLIIMIYLDIAKNKNQIIPSHLKQCLTM